MDVDECRDNNYLLHNNNSKTQLVPHTVENQENKFDR